MRHLENNLQLREYFDLGPVPPVPEKISKIAKVCSIMLCSFPLKISVGVS